ncbi:hypothetical protein BPOR_0087g00220 [Botrytis porri]|uniref:Methyltransferase domain-containing protein n=1 Tax=Botrytis porri TaxID=87229 RepID=A0A4Z1KZQ9_9HELO|nr:hypothetical protein BPOR_0087g00220 [Botrytis porri]
MSDYQTLKAEYTDQAHGYDDIALLPSGILETQLLASALGDCTGLEILDLGGGSGLRARQVLDAGAESVDLVDITPGMLQAGQEIEASLGRDKIRWLEADLTEPLGNLLEGRQYDLVMANWLFDHAPSEKALEQMWANVVANLKPGGRFVGVRSGDPRGIVPTTGKYGLRYKDIENIPGGVKMRYVLELESPLEFEATLMETSYSGSTKMHEAFGLEDIKTERPEDTEVVKKDPEFWSTFLENPGFAVVSARKRHEG